MTITKFNEKFDQYDKENPHVWDLFVRFTFELLALGKTRYSARGIFDRIRWETMITTTDDPYRISNNWSPYYARKFHKAFPDHDGFFTIRPARADREDADDTPGGTP